MPPSDAASSEGSAPAAASPRRCKFCRMATWLLVWPVCLLLLLWQTMAVYYSNLPHRLCPVGAVGVALASLFLLIRVKPLWRALALFAALFVVVAAWWALIPASNQRNWQADVAMLPWVQIAGNRVTVHEIRNCDYRSETDYDVRHYDQVFDLDKLRSVDLILSYWGSPHIAHTMFSFGFADEQYLCFSIETRKKVGQSYSTIAGFFKQYELTYVVADERDVVRLRTNYRHEQVYLYRLKARPELIRQVFLDYLKAVNSLHDRPEWYNALTSNCTTNIRRHLRPFTHGAWDWRLLANGHLPELIYERGVVDTRLPLAELKASSLINERALAAGDGADFSSRIRSGLPGISDVPGNPPAASTIEE